jgi:hypothetical protein
VSRIGRASRGSPAVCEASCRHVGAVGGEEPDLRHGPVDRLVEAQSPGVALLHQRRRLEHLRHRADAIERVRRGPDAALQIGAPEAGREHHRLVVDHADRDAHQPAVLAAFFDRLDDALDRCRDSRVPHDASGRDGRRRVPADRRGFVRRRAPRACQCGERRRACEAATDTRHGGAGVHAPDSGRPSRATRRSGSPARVITPASTSPRRERVSNVVKSRAGARVARAREQSAYAVPPTVSPSIRSVGWPTPTGTDWPSLPQVPTPVSSSRLFPIMVTRVSASGPLPMSVAPFSG